jgi:hypothetical protein
MCAVSFIYNSLCLDCEDEITDLATFLCLTLKYTLEIAGVLDLRSG